MWRRKSWSLVLALAGIAWARVVPARAQVSLEQVVRYAEQHAPDLRASRARRELGSAAREAASVWPQDNPELSVGAGPRRDSGTIGVDLEVSLEQRLEIAGERATRRRAADRFAAVLDAELDATRARVRRDVRAAYWNAVVARERAQATARVAAFSRELVGVARQRVAAGDVSSLVVMLAESDAARARQAQLAADGAYTDARLALAEVSGWPLRDVPIPSAPLGPARLPPQPGRLLFRARRSSPVLRVLEARIREARARVAAADRDRWPEPSIGVGYRREQADAPTDVVLATLRIPLPFWQRNQGLRATTRAEASVARADRDGFLAVVEVRLRRLVTAVETAARRAAAFGAGVLTRLEQGLALLQRAFEIGDVDLLQVLPAREQLLAAQRDALDAYADYYAALSELDAAVGGDPWSAPPRSRR